MNTWPATSCLEKLISEWMCMELMQKLSFGITARSQYSMLSYVSRSAPFYFWQAWYLTCERCVNVLFFPTPFKFQFAERMVGPKLAHKPIVIITGANGYVKVCQAWGSTFLNFIVESAYGICKGFFYNFAGAFYPIVVHKHLHRVSQQVNQSKCDTLV